MPLTLDRAREIALACHAAAVRGADAAAATRRALAEAPLPPAPRWWIVALGKAAPAMARAAVATLAAAGIEPAGGLVVGTSGEEPAHPLLDAMAGDHPHPGDRSLAAAGRLERLTERVEGTDGVLVLLSGGTSALVAAPAAGVDGAALRALHHGLLASGADIHLMNAVRKRFGRWGAGRLAAAVAPATVVCLAVSDVAGDDLADIGSGPCVPDPLTAGDVAALIERHGLGGHVPPALRALLGRTGAGELPETPKPGDPAFARVRARVILSNRDALAAAAAEAERLGAGPAAIGEELAGDAAAAGRAVAEALLAAAREASPGGPRVLLRGGETTVALGADHGLGGRCQELALAAAGRLDEARRDANLAAAAGRVVLLAAGTDGRDGPTDAAGAVVDAGTWARIAAAGTDAAAALRRHDAHPALDRAGALLRGGATGTNVRDVVVGVVA